MNAKGQADELREQAERTREALGDTVQQLSDKFDVQARANEGLAKAQQATSEGLAKAQQATTEGLAKAQQATAQVRDTAIGALDQAERKIDDLPAAVREPAHRTMDVVRQRPGLVLAGLLGLVVLLRLLLRRSHD